MTNITPSAEAAREVARTSAGQFGVQEHSAPEAELNSDRGIDQVLSDLADQYYADSYSLERKATQARLESFVADARRYVPDAVSARFGWDYEPGGTRLSFDCYLDENGEEVDDDSGEYPDINDFPFDRLRDAAAYGFEEEKGFDGAVIRFEEVPTRDEAKARAELSLSRTLHGIPRERDVRSLLVAAMNDNDDVPADRFTHLSEHDMEQVQAILVDAIRAAANYLRHS